MNEDSSELAFLRSSELFFSKAEEKMKNDVDKVAKMWYIIARKGESNVLNSLPQPDAKIGE